MTPIEEVTLIKMMIESHEIFNAYINFIPKTKAGKKEWKKHFDFLPNNQDWLD